MQHITLRGSVNIPLKFKIYDFNLEKSCLWHISSSKLNNIQSLREIWSELVLRLIGLSTS